MNAQYLPVAELNTALLAALAALAVGGVSVPVYVGLPADASAPYAVIGEHLLGDWGTKNWHGVENVATVHAWDEGQSQERLARLISRLVAAVTGATLNLGPAFAVANCTFLSALIVPEDDEQSGAVARYQHAVIRFRLLIEQQD